MYVLHFTDMSYLKINTYTEQNFKIICLMYNLKNKLIFINI